MAGLTLKHIYKKYPGGVTAVSDFCLDVKDKEFIIFVGPSGCGKSTTLRMIAGLEEITEGELYIGDRLVNDVAPKDRDIAMVFQNYALYPHMTVYNNMAFGLTLRKIPKDEIKRRVEEAARILDISHLLERKPKQLSGGQKQRVALGRAIVRNPKVFLLDEPLSNLDAKLRASMRTELTKLHQKVGTTFVYVTHDQVEAMTMATRIVVMKDGFIQQVDTPQNLYDLPVNKFVAGFIGTPQMNFISATLEKHGNSLYLVFGTHVVKLPENAANTPALKEYIGQEVLLGIRPEDISDDAEKVAASPETSIECTIDVTELMGAEIYLYLGFDGQEDYVDEGKNIISRVSARSTSRAGDTLKVCFDVTRAHIFDKDTERCICHCAVDPNAVPAHGIIFEEDEVAEEEVATEEVVTEEVVEETTEE